MAGRAGPPFDLGDTLVIVPTSGAARGIRRHLAARAPGVLAASFRLPMDVVRPDGAGVAGPVDREVAWTRVLRSRARFGALLPEVVRFETPEDLLGVAARLMAVCDTLAEAGLTPASEEVARECAADAARWKSFASLHGEYLAVLAAAGLRDPNAACVDFALNAPPPAGLARVFVACVPDLPRVTGLFLRRLAEAGVEVRVLAWHPGGAPGPLDDWGRPDPEWWGVNPAAVPDECVVAANTAADEAAALADFAAGSGDGGYSFVAAAPECVAPLAAEIARRGADPYSPGGRPLARTGPATLWLAWVEFERAGRLRDLRLLLDLPAFLARLGEVDPGLTAAEAVEACDWLRADRLCETVAVAEDWHRGAPEPARREAVRMKALAGRLLRAVDALRRRPPDLLEGPGPRDPDGQAETDALLGVLGEVEDSPLASAETADFRHAILRGAVARAAVFAPAPHGAVEIQGWLEAPWSGASSLCLAGCREGALPSGAADDAFLPDGVRRVLGLPTLASRFARDAYLLSALLALHGADRLRMGVSRFRPGGEPNRPSRLLFACADEALPARVRRIFQPPAARRPRPIAGGWKLGFPVAAPPDSLSATAFSRYLACPLRFYLSRVAGAQPFDPAAREISAADFGTLMHAVFDRFHRSGASVETDERAVASFLESELDREIARQYGRHPSPVVRVQTEFMKARLRAFAPAQAAARRNGWRIIETEYAVRREDGHRVGPLLLTGVIDRVEVHDELGLRILDYKTFARPKKPEETHFGPVPERLPVPSCGIVRRSAGGAERMRAWTDLQLPLYRRLAERIWPDHAARGVSAGYVLLPAEHTEAPFATLELDDAAMKSADRCAGEVAALVARGVFWPPAPAGSVEYDDFESWFGGADPADLLDPETIRALEGRP